MVTRPGSAPGEAAPPATLNLRMVVRGARRYWWLLLALWVVGSTGIGAGIYLAVKPSYQASSLLRVSPSETDLYNVRDGGGDTLDAFLKTQVSLIKSANVLAAAGTNPKAAVLPRIQAAGDVVIELQKAITVDIIPGTYLIEVSMRSSSAAEAATIVNAVVDAFIESNTEWSDGMTRAQIKALDVYLMDLRNQSDDLERRWKDLARQGELGPTVTFQQQPAAGGVKTTEAVKGLTSLSYEHYKDLQGKVFEVTMELTQAVEMANKARRDAEAASGASSAEDAGVSRNELVVKQRVENDPEVQRVYDEVRKAQDKRDDVRTRTAQPGDPAMRKAVEAHKQALNRYAKLYESKMGEYREQLQSQPESAADSPEVALKQAESRVKDLQARQKALKQEFEKIKIDNGKNAGDSVEMQVVQENWQTLRTMQEQVHRRLEQLRFEARGEARIRPVNTALAPGRPISDKRMQLMAATPVGVLALTLAIVAFLELRSARVADPDQLSNRVRHEVFSIAPLPNLRPGDPSDDLKAEQRLARFVQSLDHLRVALCEGHVAGEGRCVMITSATGGEGKTTLSAHLAARCANAGISTLLIDADMRRASLGRLLDVPIGSGLADVLSGEADLDAALVTIQAGGFHFLSAGTPGRDPARVLKSSRLAELIGRLRREYDLVLIDTPPVLPVADALIMGRWADGAVVAARYDASRLPLVERANRQLAVAGIPILGVVVNGVRGQDANYGNYAYSYNYHIRPEPPAEAPQA